jgi:hypothetical protein
MSSAITIIALSAIIAVTNSTTMTSLTVIVMTIAFPTRIIGISSNDKFIHSNNN